MAEVVRLHEIEPALSPVRGRLANIIAALRQAVERRAGIVAAAERLKSTEAAEATARAALEALDAEESAAMVKWAEAGVDAAPPDLDGKMRQRLVADLAKASAMAKAARSAGEKLVADAAEAQAEIVGLGETLQDAIQDVLVEEIQPLFAELAANEARRRVLIGKIFGLGVLFRDGGDRFDRTDERRIAILSRANELQTRIAPFIAPRVLTNGEVDPFKPAFVDLAVRLVTDPTARLEG